MTHPLTDKILHEKFNGFYDSADHTCGYSIFDADDMRAAADWQLERCTSHVTDMLFNLASDSNGYEDEPSITDKQLYKLLAKFKKAMRPKTQEDFWA